MRGRLSLLPLATLLVLAAGCGQKADDSGATAETPADKHGEAASLAFYQSQADRIQRLWNGQTGGADCPPGLFTLLDLDGDSIMELYVRTPEAEPGEESFFVGALFCCGGDSVELVAAEQFGMDAGTTLAQYPNGLVACTKPAGSSRVVTDDRPYHRTYVVVENSRPRQLGFYKVVPMGGGEPYAYFSTRDDPDERELRPVANDVAERQLAPYMAGDGSPLDFFRETATQHAQPFAALLGKAAGK